MRKIILFLMFIIISLSVHCESYISNTIKLEGKYSNHKNDSGGSTKFGITEDTARRNNYKGKMIDLSLELAHKIYKNEYWDQLRLDEINDKDLANKIFDFSINAGKEVSVKSIQEATNYAYKANILVEDGIIGSRTIETINNFKDKDRIKVLFEMIKAARYVEVVRKYPNNVSYIYGWSKRTVIYTAIKED